MVSKEAALQAQALRCSAAALLQEAALTSDSVRRDFLTRKALLQINQARSLLEPLAPFFKFPPALRLH